MPFTPSHAVVALPFLRTPLIPAAIAIGAMTPDLPLFIRRTGLTYSFTHTYANVVWTALLAGVLFAVWRLVLRPAVPEFLPERMARRLPEDWRATGVAALPELVGNGWWPRCLLVVSALLGVLSHIAWDMFTHEGRAGVEILPILDQQWGPLLGYKWLQHGSSVIGLVILGIFALLWLRRNTMGERFPRILPTWIRLVWWISLPTLLVAALAWGLVQSGGLSEEFTVQHLAYLVLPPACAIWGGITVVLCVVLLVQRKVSPVGAV